MLSQNRWIWGFAPALALGLAAGGAPAEEPEFMEKIKTRFIMTIRKR